MTTKAKRTGNPVIAAALKKARSAKGLSQAKLGELIDVDHTYVSRIEDGSRAPSRDLAQRLANVLGVEVMIAAGYIPAGYRVIKDEDAR
jgi:transcriptional regulator with XRE-family HTH domain